MTPAVSDAREDLATVPDGWPPVAWVHRLRQMADRCESLHARQAKELREAADRIEQVDVHEDGD